MRHTALSLLTILTLVVMPFPAIAQTTTAATNGAEIAGMSRERLSRIAPALKAQEGMGWTAGSKGDAMWAGAWGTSFWIDPKGEPRRRADDAGAVHARQHADALQESRVRRTGSLS